LNKSLINFDDPFKQVISKNIFNPSSFIKLYLHPNFFKFEFLFDAIP